MNKNCKIYGLYNPRTSELRYIGQTIYNIELRLKRHYNDAKKHKNKRTNWINKMLRLYGKVHIKLLQENAEWNIDEIIWIEQAKLMGCNLVNGTAGGEGMIGYQCSKATKSKMSKKAKNRYINNKHPWQGRKHSKKSKEKISMSKKGKKISNQHKKNISIATKGKNKSITFCKSISKIQQKPIICIETQIEYSSILHASQILHIDNSLIGKVCMGKRKSASGLHFIYKNPNDDHRAYR